MPIGASCGHVVENVDEMKMVEFDDECIDYDAKKFVPCTVTASYCLACAEKGILEGYLRPWCPGDVKDEKDYQPDKTQSASAKAAHAHPEGKDHRPDRAQHEG